MAYGPDTDIFGNPIDEEEEDTYDPGLTPQPSGSPGGGQVFEFPGGASEIGAGGLDAAIEGYTNEARLASEGGFGGRRTAPLRGLRGSPVNPMFASMLSGMQSRIPGYNPPGGAPEGGGETGVPEAGWYGPGANPWAAATPIPAPATPGAPAPTAPVPAAQPPAQPTPDAEMGALGGTEADGGYGVPDIDYLRGEPWSGGFEQAAIARADELVSQKYNALRRQRAQEMSNRGIGPDSPFWQSEMRKVEQAAAQESAGFRRQLQIDKMGERRSRLAEARSVEVLLDQMERQRISEMMAYLTGNQFQPTSELANILGAQSAAAGQGVGQAAGGIGEIISAWLASRQKPWYAQ